MKHLNLKLLDLSFLEPAEGLDTGDWVDQALLRLKRANAYYDEAESHSPRQLLFPSFEDETRFMEQVITPPTMRAEDRDDLLSSIVKATSATLTAIIQVTSSPSLSKISSPTRPTPNSYNPVASTEEDRANIHIGLEGVALLVIMIVLYTGQMGPVWIFSIAVYLVLGFLFQKNFIPSRLSKLIDKLQYRGAVQV